VAKTRRYTAQWVITIEAETPPGTNLQERAQDESALMLSMHAFLASEGIDEALREHLKAWAGDREIESVHVMALSAKHPDNP
jgi:hypothetical protein